MAQPIYRILGPDRTESGQVSADFIRQLIGQGQANAETLIRTEEATDWKPLGEFPDFVEDLVAAGSEPVSLAPAVVDKLPSATSFLTGFGGLLCVLICPLLGLISPVVGVLALAGGVGLGIGAVVSGRKAGKQIREKPQEFGGSGLAWTGMVLGALCVLLAFPWTGRLLTTMRNVRDRDQSRLCATQIKQIGLAARLYGKYHDRVLPPDYLTMSNELGSATLLHCPADSARPKARSWAEFTPAHASYDYIRPGAQETDVRDQLVCRCPIHGHLLYGNGQVLDATRKWAPVVESY